MNLSKSYEFFQPEKDGARIHIIGCGSVGSTIAENLARCGVAKMTFWDFDTVEAKNIANQMFTADQIGMKKVDALKDLILRINPEAEKDIVLKPDGWDGQNMSGYIFLAVDNIDIRRQIVEQHMDNMTVKAVFDVRTGLTDAQLYAADWTDYRMKQNLLTSMEFSHEEAAEATPVSACGGILGVATTVRIAAALQVNNYINFTKTKSIKKMMVFDCFQMDLDAF